MNFFNYVECNDDKCLEYNIADIYRYDLNNTATAIDMYEGVIELAEG